MEGLRQLFDWAVVMLAISIALIVGGVIWLLARLR